MSVHNWCICSLPCGYAYLVVLDLRLRQCANLIGQLPRILSNVIIFHEVDTAGVQWDSICVMVDKAPAV